jgi:hypothetical protein
MLIVDPGRGLHVVYGEAVIDDMVESAADDDDLF